MGTWSCKFLPSHLFPILWNSCTVQPHGIFPLLSLSSALEDVPACSVWGHRPDVVWCLNTTSSLQQRSRQCATHPFQQGIFFFPQKQLTSIHTPSVLSYDSMHYNSQKAVFLFKYVLSDWRHYEFNLGEDVCSGIHNAIQSCDLFSACGFTVGYIRLGNSWITGGQSVFWIIWLIVTCASQQSLFFFPGSFSKRRKKALQVLNNRILIFG